MYSNNNVIEKDIKIESNYLLGLELKLNPDCINSYGRMNTLRRELVKNTNNTNHFNVNQRFSMKGFRKFHRTLGLYRNNTFINETMGIIEIETNYKNYEKQAINWGWLQVLLIEPSKVLCNPSNPNPVY